MTEEKAFYLDRNLLIIFSITLMAVLGVSSITPVFPQMIRELNIDTRQIGLLITYFTLPGAILAPFTGIMADRLGRKRILAPSLFVFAVAGTACAFVRDFNILLILRIFQGLGAASLSAVNFTIIGDMYTGTQRVRAMGLNASVLSVGTALYPLIGGTLGLIGWYYPFALPIFAAPIGILVLTLLKNPEPRSTESIKEYLINTWKCLRGINILAYFGAGLLTFIILYGAILTYFTILLGDKFSASPFLIGLIISAMSFTTALVSSQLARINRLFSLSTTIKIAFGLYALALVIIPFMPSLWLLLIPVIIFGMGHGANFPSVQTAITGLAPLEYRAAFMSLSTTMLRLGQAIGPPVMALVYIHLELDATFYVAAALALLVPIIGTVFGGGNKS